MSVIPGKVAQASGEMPQTGPHLLFWWCALEKYQHKIQNGDVGTLPVTDLFLPPK